MADKVCESKRMPLGVWSCLPGRPQIPASQGWLTGLGSGVGGTKGSGARSGRLGTLQVDPTDKGDSDDRRWKRPRPGWHPY